MPGALRSLLYGQLRGIGDVGGASGGVRSTARGDVDLRVELTKWAGAGDFLGGDGGEYRLGIYGTERSVSKTLLPRSPDERAVRS